MPLRRESRDAVVVGGGPAGAVAGIGLRRLGWGVLLLEKGRARRVKACGHCLNAQGAAMLESLGLSAAVGDATIGATRLVRVHGSAHRAMSADLAPGVVIDRSIFDERLRDAAAALGVEVELQASARLVETDAPGAIVEARSVRGVRRIEAGLVIGADGVGSAVARQAGLADRAAAGRKFGFSFEIENARRELDSDHPRGCISMFIAAGGYLGAVNAGRNIHAAGLVDAAGASGSIDPASFLASVAEIHPAVARLVERIEQVRDQPGWAACGPMPWRPRAVASGSVALVGDAAGYVEPFTGQGLHWAVESAAALAVAAAPVGPGAWNDAAARHYQWAWQERVRARQAACRGLAFALRRPALARTMVFVGRGMPGLARRLVRRMVTS